MPKRMPLNCYLVLSIFSDRNNLREWASKGFEDYLGPTGREVKIFDFVLGLNQRRGCRECIVWFNLDFESVVRFQVKRTITFKHPKQYVG